MGGKSIAALVFGGPDLAGNARRTFRFHLAYALLDAAAGGILLNAPLVALKAFQAANWHLPLRELYSGIGMIATLYLGSWMARRPKMPFVFLPGLLAAISSLAMAAATGSAFWFLTLFGIGAMFEITTRPAVTAILRANYPVERRGHATGEVRKWSSLAFLTSSLVSAYLLQLAADHDAVVAEIARPAPTEGALHWSSHHAAEALMILAGILSLASFICFREIRVKERPEELLHDLRPEVARSLREALAVVTRDARYRRYLLGCFVDGFCQMLYFPLIWAFLTKRLEFGYVTSSAMMHAIPALVAFAVTGALGRWFDRTNPWFSWAWVRFVWGLDAILLAITPEAAALLAPALVVLPLMARLLRGSVQGGWWILWWQIGVTHFAPPGEDTSRYMGIMVFLSGATRFLASATGMVLAALAIAPSTLMTVGGLGVMASGLYSLWQGARERREHLPETMTDFETQFRKPRQ